tara:strand:+ start:71 stop:259 length:189 start_codon:yes stop_codon:yes gene_type:complete
MVKMSSGNNVKETSEAVAVVVVRGEVVPGVVVAVVVVVVVVVRVVLLGRAMVLNAELEGIGV